MNAPAPIPKDVAQRGAQRESQCDRPHAGAGRSDAADRAGAERLPAHGRADQRRPLLVPGHAFLRRRTAPTPLMLTASYTLLEGRGPAEPLVLAGEQRPIPKLDRGRTGADTPAQLRDQRHVERARQRRHHSAAGASAPSRTPERLAVLPFAMPATRRVRRLGAAAAPAAARPARPADATPRAASSSTTRTSRWRASSRVGDDHIEFRADMFNVFNNQNLLAGGYISLVGNPPLRTAHGRQCERLPGRQFQFATTYRF